MIVCRWKLQTVKIVSKLKKNNKDQCSSKIEKKLIVNCCHSKHSRNVKPCIFFFDKCSDSVCGGSFLYFACLLKTYKDLRKKRHKKSLNMLYSKGLIWAFVQDH